MLKLVEVINTLPKKVCRVVLYAESKDDISQAALDEFQNKSGSTVATRPASIVEPSLI